MVLINSFVYPESNVRYQQRNVRVILDKNDLGLGQLYISDSTLAWQQDGNRGFTVPYVDISLHAISKDDNVYSKECIYIITDEELSMPGMPRQENLDSSDDEGANSNSTISEILLVPECEEASHSEIIKVIYEAIKICQELNPDPDDIDDDEEDNLYEDAEEEMIEAEYEVEETGDGDADINELTRRIQHNSMSVKLDHSNGNTNDDEDFQDAD